MKNEKIQVDRVSRDVIEGKLLASLDDGAHVAIVLGQAELQTLINALDYADDDWHDDANRRMSQEMYRDLVRLNHEAFGD